LVLFFRKEPLASLSRPRLAPQFFHGPRHPSPLRCPLPVILRNALRGMLFRNGNGTNPMPVDQRASQFDFTIRLHS
jgi:hypothetical protein